MVYQVELLNPEARALLENLAKLKLIRFKVFGAAARNGAPHLPASNENAGEQAVPNISVEEEPVQAQAAAPFSLEGIQLGFGCLKDKIHLAPDWDEPLEDFKEYMY